MKMKTWLMAAGILVLAGCILFGGVMMALNWDFSKLSTVNYVENSYTATETFTSILVQTDTANIIFAPTDGPCTVVCKEEETATHDVFVENGTLHIVMKDRRKWYDHIGIRIGTPRITVSLPQRQYAELTVKNDTGDVTLSGQLRLGAADISVSTGSISLTDITAESATLHTNTGKVDLSRVTCNGVLGMLAGTGKIIAKDVRCGELVATGGTGDITLINAVADQRFTISCSTGDVQFVQCDAPEIHASTATGDVHGSLLTGKTFDAKTQTGKVRVPANSGTGSCYIRTQTGKINITVE